MKFKVDENLPVEVVVALKGRGYDAMTVVEQGFGGHSDTKVAEVCKSEGRVLVTLDLDFANVQSFPPQEYAGIIVMRLERQDKPHVLAVFETVLPLLGIEPLEHRLWIVDETRLRVRQ